jgi:excisionase family DNA binding protein
MAIGEPLPHLRSVQRGNGRTARGRDRRPRTAPDAGRAEASPADPTVDAQLAQLPSFPPGQVIVVHYPPGEAGGTARSVWDLVDGIGLAAPSAAAAKTQPAQATRITVSASEAAELLGVSRSHVYQLIRLGILPHLRLGRRIIVPRAELEAWVRGETGGGRIRP